METNEPKDQALTREDIQRLEAMFHQSAQEMYVLVHPIAGLVNCTYLFDLANGNIQQ